MDRWCRLAVAMALSIGLFPVVSRSADGVPAESIARLREFTDAALDAIRKDDVPLFVEALAEQAGWNEEQKLKNLQKVAESRGLLRGAIGPGEDRIEFVKAQTIGDSFVRLIYLEHHVGSAVVWRFVFYRPRNEWRMINMTWDGNLEPLFQDVPSATPASAIR